MEKREPSYTVCRNVNWYNHCGEPYVRFLKKLNTELPYDPKIPLPGTYLNKAIQKDTCIPMFKAALFTTVKSGKQPKYPSVEEWIKKMWYI